MKKHYIFIDESGSSDPKTYKESPVFTVCAMVIGSNSRDEFEKDLESIKLKYFKSKSFDILFVNKFCLRKFTHFITRCTRGVAPIIFVGKPKTHKRRSPDMLVNDTIQINIFHRIEFQIFSGATNIHL